MNNSIYESINTSVYKSLDTSCKTDIVRYTSEYVVELDIWSIMYNTMYNTIWSTVRSSAVNNIWGYTDQAIREMNNYE